MAVVALGKLISIIITAAYIVVKIIEKNDGN